MENNEHDKKLAQSDRVRELVKSDIFQELLQILALKIKESDTIRDIDDTKNLNTIAIKQVAKKLAVEMIESWLAEIVGICNFEEFTRKHIEKQDDIIKQLK